MDFTKLVDPSKIVGRTDSGTSLYGPKRKTPVNYTSRKNTGRATVVNGYEGETGTWVTLFDKQRNARVVVRPSQVSA